MTMVLLLVSLLASVAGAICGIGGGVIMKPLLDSLHIANVSTISFLSSCTVLCMSCYSVGKALSAKDSLVDFRTGTPLALGAAAGGIAGKYLYSVVQSMAAQPETVGGWQALCLGILTLGTLGYTLFQNKIKTHNVKHPAPCVGIGVALGLLSSFLGIGGGPVNLVVLYFFFSMSTKTAAQNSLYIILISQLTSLGTTLFTNSVPTFHWQWLVVMTAGGICGGALGRIFNKRIQDKQVRSLFIGLMCLIVLISIYNTVRFFS